jgi:Sec-independent protein translocase protein TatA
MFGGPGGGGFLNMGTPEMIVIGACAWALLGPKELYRLAKEAGKFLGEWQQLGLQAKNTFQDALETELAVDEMNKEAEKQPAAPAPATDFSDMPTLEEMEEQRRRQELEDAPPLSGLADSPETPGWASNSFEPEASPSFGGVDGVEDVSAGQSKFMQQLSGDVNRQVMDEYPQELGPEDETLGVDEAEERVIAAEEALIDTRIQEAENQLAMLRTEAKVLELRKQQQQANAARATAAQATANAASKEPSEATPPQ